MFGNKTLNEQNGALNFIKLFAAIIIMVHHYQLNTGIQFSIINFSNDYIFNGSYMVELFFMISGFLSFSSQDRIHKKESFKDFFKKKYTRLIPLVIASSVVTFIIKSIYVIKRGQPVAGNISVYSLLISCLGIQCGWINGNINYGVNETLWYVSVLLLCYVIFYYVVCRCNDSESLTIKYIAIIILGFCIEYMGWQYPFLNQYTSRGFIAFFGGLLTANFCDYLKKKEKSIDLICLIIFTVMCIFYVSVHYVYRTGIVENIDFAILNYRYVLILLVYPSLIILTQNHVIKKIFNRPWIHFWGGASFHVYVWHLPFLFVRLLTYDYWGLCRNSILDVIFTVICVEIISAITYSIEKKIF